MVTTFITTYKRTKLYKKKRERKKNEKKKELEKRNKINTENKIILTSHKMKMHLDLAPKTWQND